MTKPKSEILAHSSSIKANTIATSFGGESK